MITENEMRQILDMALSTGGDFAELFFEDREETNIRSVEQTVQGVKKIRICGVGLTVLRGVQNVYVYTNQMSFEGLMRLAKRAAEMIRPAEADRIRSAGQAGAAGSEAACRSGAAGRETACCGVASGSAAACRAGAETRMDSASDCGTAFTRREYRNPNVIRIYPGTVAYGDKIRVLGQADRAARSAGPNVLALNVDYFDNDQRILVANSEGLLASDRRVTSRMRFQLTVGDEKESFFEWEDYTRPQGFEAFEEPELAEAFARDFVLRTDRMRLAVPAKACRVPVVLDAGACGTLWHECCGHGLEASAIASGQSIYCGMLGKRVASDRVTLLDDGTWPGLYGSAAIDDEGHPKQKNVLIENGILKSYLCDRLHGRMIGQESNGCGRKQNYTYAATSRMSNTYLAAGMDEEEEIIRSVPEGLFVKSFGGGTGGAMFTLSVKEGFWIKNGKIDHQVKGLMLNGNGLEVMQKVDRVGKCLKTENGGFCGAASGLIPVTSFQPMVRISEMSVGGEGGAS